MNVGVIGAGTIGAGLVRRLVTTEFVSEVTWVNRTLERIEAEIIDLQQGLGFSPSYSVPCRVGRAGTIDRIVPEHPGVHDGLERCRNQLRLDIATLRASVER